MGPLRYNRPPVRLEPLQTNPWCGMPRAHQKPDAIAPSWSRLIFSAQRHGGVSIIGCSGKMSPDQRLDSFGCVRLYCGRDRAPALSNRAAVFFEGHCRTGLQRKSLAGQQAFMPIIHSKYVAFHFWCPLTGSRKPAELEQGYDCRHFLPTCPSV